MKKQTLLNLTPVPLPTVNVGIGTGIYFICSAEQFQADKITVLRLSFFDADSKQLLYSVFCDSENSRFLSYRHQDIKYRWHYKAYKTGWSEATIENLLVYYDAFNKIAYANKESELAAARYFNIGEKEGVIRDTISIVRDWQKDIRQNSLSVQWHRKRQAIDEIMDQAKPLPDDIHEWVDRVPLKSARYLYYVRQGKKLLTYCTHCGQEGETQIPRKGRLIGTIGICPCCKTKAVLRSKKITTTLVDKAEFEIIDRLRDGILIRHFTATRQIPKDYMCGERDEWYTESVRHYISFSGRQTVYTFENRYSGAHGGVVSAWFIDGNGYNYCTDGHVYRKGLKTLLHDTPFKYSQLWAFRPNDIISANLYLSAYKKAPVIEHLQKVKLNRLIDDILHSNAGRFLETSDTDMKLHAALGIPKQELKELIKLDISGDELNLWKKRRQSGLKISFEDIRLIRKKKIDQISALYRHKNITRAIRYFEAQQVAAPQTYQSIANVINDYEDYMRECACLELDLTSEDESILYPRSLETQHREMTIMRKVKDDGEADKKIRSMHKDLNMRYGFESDGFIVRIPVTAEDIIREGENLHHCVGRYLDKMANGRCVILFIRKSEDPETSFVTAEINNNKLIQIRASRNQTPPPEVLEFWNKFEQKKLKKRKNRKAG